MAWLLKSSCISGEPGPRMERHELNHQVRANRSVVVKTAEGYWVAASSFAQHMVMILEASSTWSTVGIIVGDIRSRWLLPDWLSIMIAN